MTGNGPPRPLQSEMQSSVRRILRSRAIFLTRTASLIDNRAEAVAGGNAKRVRQRSTKQNDCQQTRMAAPHLTQRLAGA
jgi:hypothetical protein